MCTGNSWKMERTSSQPSSPIVASGGANGPLLKRLVVHRPNLTALGLYLLISILFFGLRVASDPAAVHVGFTSDVAMMMWYLVWWPYALVHGVNPFITHAVWPVTGYNL